MKILVSGAKGFVGKNLVAQLENIRDNKARWYNIGEDLEVFKYDLDSTDKELTDYCKKCDFVFHLAGVNRPKDNAEFMEGNCFLTDKLLQTLALCGNKSPIVMASSIQCESDNEYGRSKLAGEKVLRDYASKYGVRIFIYRFANIFGKWCRPNYNSVVATFCNNIANDLPIRIDNKDSGLRLIYIDDVVDSLIACLTDKEDKSKSFCSIEPEYRLTVGELAEKIETIYENRKKDIVPDMSEEFEKKLYSTFISYLPAEKFKIAHLSHVDERGSFTQLFSSSSFGQVSVNICKPGMTKGEHWHNSKVEKFVVVKGKGLIELRKEGMDENGKNNEVVSFEVDADRICSVEMIPGYTHRFKNLSQDEDLVVLIWANEIFDPERPETYSDRVE